MFSYGDLVYAGWGRPVVFYDAMMIKHWDGPYWSEYNPAFGTSRFIPQRFFANDCIWCQDCQSMNENGCCKAIVKGTNVVCQPWQVHLREEFIYLKNPITKWYYKRPKWYRFRIDPVPHVGGKYSGACKRGDSGNGLLFASLKRGRDIQVLDYDSEDKEIFFEHRHSENAWVDSGMECWDRPHERWEHDKCWKRMKNARRQWQKHVR